MAEYTAWYRVGTVALTKNSKIVTGTGTFWLAAGLHTGDIFSTDCVTEYEVASVDSNTQITLRTPYLGDSTTETAYRIIRNFTASMAAETAADTAALLNDFRRFVDLDMQSIHGKSAYQVACSKGYAGTESEWLESLTAYGLARANGYSGTIAQWIESLKGDSAYDVAVKNGYNGTESEWLESLKAAQEWSTLDARTSVLDRSLIYGTRWNGNPFGQPNSIFRGKNLGPFTADHLVAIKSRRYTDMFVGDYFTHENGKIDVIAKIHNSTQGDNRSGDVMLIRQQYLTKADGYYGVYNRAPSGTEGEEDYDPGTMGKYYLESTWYTADRPKFIEEIEGIYGADNVKSFLIGVPTAYDSNGEPTAWAIPYSKAHLPTLTMLGLPGFSPSVYRNCGNLCKGAEMTLPLFAHTHQWSATHKGAGYNWTAMTTAAESFPWRNGRVRTMGAIFGNLSTGMEEIAGYPNGSQFGGLIFPIFIIG